MKRAFTMALLLATPALGWLPRTHPLHGTLEDGCTVSLLALTIVSVESTSWTVEWDENGDGVYDRSEVHYKGSFDRWSLYGPPLRFDADTPTLVPWRVTYSPPLAGNAEAWYFPHAFCPSEVWPDGQVNWICWDTRGAEGAVGRALFDRRVWELENDHPYYNPEGRPCPELEPPAPPPAEIFADGFESGRPDAWSRTVGYDPTRIFRDGFESGGTSRWSQVKP